MLEEVERLLTEGVTYERLNFFGLEYKYVGLYLIGKLNYNDFYPYTVIAGEIARFRFSLNLNKLGKGFLAVQKYILNDEVI